MKIFTTLCCAALALGSALYAQAPADHMTTRFNAPVIVGETTLPAGDCDIQITHAASGNIIIVFRSQSGLSTAAVASRVSESPDIEGSTSVIFNRHNGDLHLYRVMLSDHTGYQLSDVE